MSIHVSDSSSSIDDECWFIYAHQRDYSKIKHVQFKVIGLNVFIYLLHPTNEAITTNTPADTNETSNDVVITNTPGGLLSYRTVCCYCVYIVGGGRWGGCGDYCGSCWCWWGRITDSMCLWEVEVNLFGLKKECNTSTAPRGDITLRKMRGKRGILGGRK